MHYVYNINNVFCRKGWYTSQNEFKPAKYNLFVLWVRLKFLTSVAFLQTQGNHGYSEPTSAESSASLDPFITSGKFFFFLVVICIWLIEEKGIILQNNLLDILPGFHHLVIVVFSGQFSKHNFKKYNKEN